MTATPIIILEDDKELGEAFAEIFELEGYAVTLLRDGKTIMERLKEHRPSILILDLHLPKVSGLDILPALKSGFVRYAAGVAALGES